MLPKEVEVLVKPFPNFCHCWIFPSRFPEAEQASPDYDKTRQKSLPKSKRRMRPLEKISIVAAQLEATPPFPGGATSILRKVGFVFITAERTGLAEGNFHAGLAA